MKHLIIGTAGHVDHGKTCLTKALTGVDTDRLAEEQKRGITIELGFARLTLPNGREAGIVDVPGHERFVRNMLAGATGMDVVLLVVAADEGFMPQTREHLDILSLLHVKNGIVVLTKADMVDEDWLEVVREDTREQVKGTFLEDAPIVTVSAYTGMGLETLKEEIVRMVEGTESRKTYKPFRLPVDRAFSMKGFGTVITGTLVDGTLSVGDTVMVYPQEKLARVRELQNHDRKVETVEAGMRVAVNVSGLDRQELTRGCTVAEPDSMELSRQLTVRLQMTPDAPFTVKNSSRLHLYLGTQERVCKVRLLDGDELVPGQEGYALLTCEEPVAARNLDRFILRFFSPMTTVAGGQVLDLEPGRLRRRDPEVLGRLERLGGTPAQRLSQMVRDAGWALPPEEELIRRSGFSAPEGRETLEKLLQEGSVIRLEGGLAARETLEALWERLHSLLQDYHRANSLQEGYHLGELREKLFPNGSKATADAVLDYYVRMGKLRLTGSCAALKEFRCSFSPAQRAMQGELEKRYLDFGLQVPQTADLAREYDTRQKLFLQVVNKMQQDGILVALTPQTLAHRDVCRQALENFVEMFRQSDTVTLGDFRTRMGVSRKYAQLFLDYFDRLKISRLTGDRRILLKPDCLNPEK